MLHALVAVMTLSQAAVAGEVVAAFQRYAGKYAVMSATNGKSLTYVSCGGDLSHGGSPRYFLTAKASGNYLPDGYLDNELVASDEDCALSLTISDTPSIRFSNLPHWSPDGTKIAVYGDNFDLINGGMIERGIYLADVVYSGSRPAGIANLRLAIPVAGERMISWAADSRRLAYVDAGVGGSDIFVADTDTGIVTNVTNSANVSEDHPAFSAAERIAYTRQVAIRGGYRYDLFSRPAAGGAEFTVTTKATTGGMANQFPCYSPDGLSLSFNSGSTTGYRAIYRMKADASAKALKLAGANGQDYTVNFWRQ